MDEEILERVMLGQGTLARKQGNMRRAREGQSGRGRQGGEKRNRPDLPIVPFPSPLSPTLLSVYTLHPLNSHRA
jgi:hypothetical protein